jgi:hypothetical protein
MNPQVKMFCLAAIRGKYKSEGKEKGIKKKR